MTQAPKDALRFSPQWLRHGKTMATHARSLAWLSRGGRPRHDGMRILFYHRITDERDPLAVRVGRFREQMEWLAAEGFRVVDVTTAVRSLTQPAARTGPDGTAQQRVIGLSFDDGYRDVAENALPVLEELGFSATVFVVTGAVDGNVAFSWYERQPELLGWQEIERLDATSVLRFEAHSETHANLRTLHLDAARSELQRSKATLESRLGRPVAAFCYPAGVFGERERHLAAECGFELAVSSEPGANDARTDPLALRRMQIEPSDRLLDFRAKVGGGHDRALPLRAAYRRRRYGATAERGDDAGASVVIVGAGPYGLAAAAHLHDAGVPTRVFGRTMEYWREHMPERMSLRSILEASHISDPGKALGLDRYEAMRGAPLPEPIPIEDFIAYGEWFQRRAVPNVDARRVSRIAAAAGRFDLTLDDGTELSADRVIVAAGLEPFAWMPPELRSLPPELVSHSADLHDLRTFAGRRVLVIGGGQSALETAALLSEASADVELVARASGLRWLAPGEMKKRSPLLHSILYPPSDIGPPGLNWLVYFPRAWRMLPPRQRRWVAYRCIRPAGAVWLKDRLAPVTLRLNGEIDAVAAEAGTVRVRLDDGSERTVDHVVAATGFQVDVARYGFLDADLVHSLEVDDGYPVLGPGFESSVRGLHFLGAPSAASFGPLMRFVAGTRYAGPSLARFVAGRRRAGHAAASRGHAQPAIKTR